MLISLSVAMHLALFNLHFDILIEKSLFEVQTLVAI